MAGESKRLVDVLLVNSISTSDTLFGTVGGAVSQLPPNTVFSNIALQVSSVLVSRNDTPINSTINVASGTIWFDANYAYFAVANNLIKRVSLSSF